MILARFECTRRERNQGLARSRVAPRCIYAELSACQGAGEAPNPAIAIACATDFTQALPERGARSSIRSSPAHAN